MINNKNIFKFIVSFESILISSFIPINLPTLSTDRFYRILEIPTNYQIPMVIFLTLIFSGEFLTKVYSIYLLIGLFFFPIFYDGGSLGYLMTPNFGYLIGIFPLISIVNILNKKNNLSFINYIKYSLVGLISMHFMGILYLIFKFYIFNKANLIAYNIGLYTLSKLPLQIIFLIPVFYSIKLINNLRK